MSETQEPEAEGSKHTKAVIKALLSAVEDVDESSEHAFSCKALIRLFHPSKRIDFIVNGISPKQQQSLILETIQSLPKGPVKRLFSGLKSILETILSEEAYVPESAFQEDDEDAEIMGDEKSTKCLHFMKYAAMCSEAFLEGQIAHTKRKSVGMQLQILPQVYDVAADLHNALLSVHDCGPESLGTETAIISLCESWWLANAMHRDTLIAQCLPLLVVQALDGQEFQKSQIKKLYKLKDAFQVVDFTNPSSDSLRSLLLRVASNPLCLRMPEGNKFLASLFQDPDLVTDLHLAFRAQIPDAKKTILQAYGEIYRKAWKQAADAAPEVRDAIEHQALQDLMHAAIHVSSPAMAKFILTVLEPVHADKKSPQVAGLLYRLYSPILWRSLAAANPLVRKNAVTVLEQVYPLQDPSQTQMKEAVSKGTAALKSALQDVDPRVRVAGSEATARICAMFWDALPAADIRMLLNHIVMEHSSDTTSSAVRAAALEATMTLLDAPQSHAVLRALLPSLGNLIHDKAERVRVAAVKLLRRIKQIQGIRFYHVVPVDHLTARLSEEKRIHRSPRNVVAKELTALMLSSYFPQGPKVSATSQLQRTLTFILTDPSAAAVFYANLADHLEVESVAKFICMLLACLKSAVNVDQANQVKNSQKRKKRRRRAEESDEEDDNHNLSASNTALMAGLTETICVLWESIETSLSDPQNEPSKELLAQRFGEAHLVNILSHFEQKASEHDSPNDEDESNRRDESLRACSAILRCAARLPQDAIDGIVSFISTSLSDLSNEMDGGCRHISSHFALLCVWGMTDEVASALATSIESAFGDDISLMSPCFDDYEEGARRSRRSSTNHKKHGKVDVPSFPPKVAWSIVDSILKGSDPSSEAVRKAILANTSACSSIESALERGTIFAERLLVADGLIGRSLKESEVEFILCSCEAYGRFSLHKEAHKDNELGFNRQAKLLLDWTTEKVIPALQGAQSGETELGNLDLSRISNVSDSLILPGSPSPMSPPKQRANLLRTPGRLGGMSSSLSELDRTLNEPTVFLVSALARSLLQSSCVIFAELLAVGCLCGDAIARSAVHWCKIFEEEEKETEDDANFVQRELLPSFIRLAVHLCKSTGSFALLKELFVKCNEGALEDEGELIKKAVSSLLGSRSSDGSKLVDGPIDAFLSAADELLGSTEMEISFEVTDTARGVWSHSKGCVGAALEGIIGNRNASLSLAKKLVLNLASCGGEGNAKTAFEARCLSLLIKTTSSSTAMARILSDLNVESFEECGEIRGLVQQLLESTS